MIYLVNRSGTSGSKVAKGATIEDALDYFNYHTEIQLDTETMGFDPYTCKLLSIQLGDKDNQYVIDCTEISAVEIKSLLERDDITYVLQNAKFDLKFFLHQGINIPVVYDTFLAEKILTNGDLSVRRALDHLVLRYCDVTLSKEIRNQIQTRGLDDAVIEYAARDVIYLSKIKKLQLERAEELDLTKAISLDNKYVRVLAYTEYGGFKLDTNKWKTKCEKDEEEFKESELKLNQYIFDNNITRYIDNQLDMFSSDKKVSINWSSSHQVIELFKDLGINVEVDEKGKKKESVDAKVIKPQAGDFEILPMYLHFKGMEKKVTTYGRNWFKQVNPISNRIHTNFNQLMDTGRLSSGGNDTINFQNIPADSTRECFTPERGNTFVVADYSGQEQIVLANFSEDDDLISFYAQNLGDMHSFVASKIYPELKDLTLKEIKSKHKDKRQIAKSAGFAINYGGNGFTISNNLGITPAEGDEVYKAYFNAFPGLNNYFDGIKSNALENGYIEFNQITGRKLFFDNGWYKDAKEKFDSQYWEIYRTNKQNNTALFRDVLGPEVKHYFRTKSAIERKSQNFPIQGSAADITKTAGILFFKWLEEEGLLHRVLIPNFVHDEIVCEAPLNIADKVGQKLKECMETAGNYFCKIIPLKAEPEI
jgi:DNA polymerase I-like protein with 3'-5' exonuclease and polymerase domains